MERTGPRGACRDPWAGREAVRATPEAPEAQAVRVVQAVRAVPSAQRAVQAAAPSARPEERAAAPSARPGADSRRSDQPWAAGHPSHA